MKKPKPSQTARSAAASLPATGKPSAAAKADVPYRTRVQVRLLRIAERILEDEGLEAVQARRLAKEADCSVGTVYNVFGGLDGLIVAANTQTLRAFGRAAAVALKRAADNDVESRLLALALAYFDFAVTHDRRWRAVFAHQLPETYEVPEEMKSDQARLFALIEESIATAVTDAAERALYARALFASVHGIVALALDRKIGNDDIRQTERQIRVVVGLFARGLTRT